MLSRRPFFTFVSLLGTAFTLLILVAGTAILDCLVGPYPPESKGERILKIDWVMLSAAEAFKTRSVTGAGPGFVRLVEQMRTPQRWAVTSRNRAAVSYQGGVKAVLMEKRTDAAYWQIMTFAFIEGRPFTVAEDTATEPVAVISDRTRAPVR